MHRNGTGWMAGARKAASRLLPLLLLLPAAALPVERNEAVDRCLRSAEVLKKIMAVSDRAIPSDLLLKAHCIAIIPGMKKGAFIFGAKFGKGMVSCRGEGRKGWTAPAMIRIEGGSFGLQIGGSSTDVVLLVMNESGKRKLLESKFTLGADVAAAAGPVGRSGQAQTDAQMTAGILSYSRSRGVFAGISLEGATLRADQESNRMLYGGGVGPRDILSGRVAAPEGVQPLISTLERYSSYEHQ